MFILCRRVITELNGLSKEEKIMVDKKVTIQEEKKKKKSGCVNVAIVQAGYNGKKWTI